jgi:methylthioribose-1-phosphate isomerase
VFDSVKRVVTPLRWDGRELWILDQRKLPGRIVWIRARTAEQTARAIESLAVRGAPVIGIAAAYGVALAALRSGATAQSITHAIERLARTRPTGYNLFHALNGLRLLAARSRGNITAAIVRRAVKIHRDDARSCLQMAKAGAALMRKGERILTYCNTGALATGGIGTALGVIHFGYQTGKVAEVFACETRPVGQGARLTVWECAQAGIPCTLLCDNMVASLLSTKKISRVIVGADRIARNGDTSNKIGTLQLALLARAYRIPFHIAAPFSTFDGSLRSGKAMPIEQRPPAEITGWYDGLSAGKNFEVWNPAFDVTPAKLITSYITDRGILHPPFDRAD